MYLKIKVKVKSLSHVQFFANLWTVAHQAPPSIGFSRQESWSGLPFPSPGDLPDSGSKPVSPALARVFHHWAAWKTPHPYELWWRLNFQGDIQPYPEKVIGFKTIPERIMFCKDKSWLHLTKNVFLTYMIESNVVSFLRLANSRPVIQSGSVLTLGQGNSSLKHSTEYIEWIL